MTQTLIQTGSVALGDSAANAPANEVFYVAYDRSRSCQFLANNSLIFRTAGNDVRKHCP